MAGSMTADGVLAFVLAWAILVSLMAWVRPGAVLVPPRRAAYSGSSRNLILVTRWTARNRRPRIHCVIAG